MIDAVEQKEFAEKALQAFKLDRDNRERQKDLAEMAAQALRQGHCFLARELAAVGLRAAEPLEQLVRYHTLAGHLLEADKALAGDAFQPFIASLRQASASDEKGEAATAIRTLLDKAITQSSEASRLDILHELRRFVHEAGPDTAPHRRLEEQIAAVEERLRRTVGDLKLQARELMAREKYHLDGDGYQLSDDASWSVSRLLDYLDNRQSRLQKIVKMTKEALAIHKQLPAGLGTESEVQALHEEAARRLGGLSQNAQALQAERERERTRLEDLHSKIQEKQQRESVADELRELVVDTTRYLAGSDEREIVRDKVEEIQRWAVQELMAQKQRKSWLQLQQLAEEGLAKLDKEFDAAQTDFRAGKLDAARGRLNALLVENSDREEWQRLAVRIEGADYLPSFLKEAPDSELTAGNWRLNHVIKECHELINLELPEAYWQDGESFFESVDRAIRQKARDNLDNDNAFQDIARDWLAFELLRRRRKAADPGGEWKAEKFLQQIAVALRQRSINGVARVVERTPTPSVPEAAFEQLTPEAWRRALRTATDSRIPWLDNPRLVAALAGVAIIIIVLASFGIYALTSGNNPLSLLFGDPTATPTATTTVIAVVTSDPTASATVTPTVTSTTTPTATPSATPTASPTATPTLTPPEASNLYLSPEAIAALAPPVPQVAQAAWMWPSDTTLMEPPPESSAISWETHAEEGRMPFRYTESLTQTVTLTWTLDIALNEGLYQLYALDTADFSAGSQTFTVSLDGEPAGPIRGQSQVIYANRTERGDAWLPIGVYQVGQGQRLMINSQIEPGREGAFAVAPLLMVYLTPEQQAMVDQLPQGRMLVSLVDDAEIRWASMRDVDTWDDSTTDLERHEDPNAWNGAFSSRPFNPAVHLGIRADWRPFGRLAAGQYELRVWVPDTQATALANYTLVVDGQPINPQKWNSLAQNENQSAARELGWVSLGIWTLESEAEVGVRLEVLGPSVAGVAGVGQEVQTVEARIGADAVAILRVGE